MFKNYNKVDLMSRINYDITLDEKGNPIKKDNEYTIEQIKADFPFLGKKEQYVLYIQKNPTQTEKNDYYQYCIDKINEREKKQLNELFPMGLYHDN